MLQGFHLGQCFWEAVSNQVVIDVMCISRAIGERESRPSETSAPDALACVVAETALLGKRADELTDETYTD